MLVTPLGPSKSLLGCSWSALGCSWGRLGDLSNLSWDPLGQSWSHLEASDGHRKRTGDDAESSVVPQMFERVWPLRGLIGELFGHLEPPIRLRHTWRARPPKRKLPPLG